MARSLPLFEEQLEALLLFPFVSSLTSPVEVWSLVDVPDSASSIRTPL